MKGEASGAGVEHSTWTVGRGQQLHFHNLHKAKITIDKQCSIPHLEDTINCEY